MKELDLLREEIDKVDEKLIELFEKRMALVERIAMVKKENNLGIFDSVREKEVMLRGLNLLKNKNLAPELEIFLENLMKLSKDIQKN